MTKIIFFFLFFTSCSSLQFESSGVMDLGFGTKEEHNSEFAVEGQREFFFWGFYPSSAVVKVDQELASLGLKSAHHLQVEEYQTLAGFCWTVLSLGLYHPVYYKITVLGKKDERRDL